jgi:HEPN domain-containing protein
LRHARADLAMARVPKSDEMMYEGLCFHAQQAAEKSIKAVLVYLGIEYPKTHSIKWLIELLPPDIHRTDDLIVSTKLSSYATILRYPGEIEPATEDKYLEAIQLAEAVVEWAEEIIASSPS